VHAVRAPHSFDGEAFRTGGVTVLIEDGRIVGVESYEFAVPSDCPVTNLTGTLLPGLIDAHTHLVTDSGPGALDRVAGYSDDEIDRVVTEALRLQLEAGVTTVRDLGDRDFVVVGRRDSQRPDTVEPTIVASGPPLTSRGGHCHYLGGEASGVSEIRAAVKERADRGVDVVKVMASGGVNTPGSDVLLTQFTTDELRLMVDLAHEAGLPITTHAHGTPAVEQAVEVGVDGIEHCSCVTDHGFNQASDELIAALASSGIVVCPTLGFDPALMGSPPPALAALVEQFGKTVPEMAQERGRFVASLHRAGVRLISGVDSGINPGKRHGVLPFSVKALVTAGLGVADALATATSVTAEACRVGGAKGRIAIDYDADLVHVDGDLQADIDALLGAKTVWLRGVAV
jgi:imidazolonepropionase-like amidohydrolase